MLALRIATKKDASEIAQLGAVAFKHYFENDNNREELLPYLKKAFSEEAILKEFEADKNHFLLAVEEDKVLGFARLWEDLDENAPDNSLKMERLYLWPKEVGKGVGAFLMRQSIELAKSEGYKTLWLQVLRPNKLAHGFYLKWNFEEFHQSPGKFKGDNEIDLWMKRKI